MLYNIFVASYQDNAMADKKKVFISYKRNAEPDEQIALEIFSRLSKLHDVFIDLKMMVGTKWSKEIKDNLLSSDFFISLISEYSVKSDMIAAEIQFAYKHSKLYGKPIILPVRLNYFEDLEYDLTAYLDSRNYIIWRDYTDTLNIVEQLKQAISGDRFSDEKVLELIKQKARDKEKYIRRLLSGGDFKNARIECEKLLEQNAENHLVHLLLAVSILSKKGTNTRLSLINRAEKHLEKACENENIRPTALIFLGVIKHDHYFLGGLPQMRPTLDDIRKILEKLSIDKIDLELLELAEIDSITYKALGLPQFT